jgi:hypothetical protein
MKRRLLIALAALIASPAHAADAPVCPDRPGKGTGTCTVSAGVWQIETGLVDWTHDDSAGVRTDFTLIGSTLLKLGITGNADVELGFTPYAISRVRGPQGLARASGFGDMVVRSKVRLTDDDEPVQLALDPVVKIPTARHALGNGKVEAGLTVPIAIALGKGPLSLAFAPEVDWRADGDGNGHHAAMIQLIDLGIAASSRLALTAELWALWDWNPARTSRQYSADGAVAYLLSNSIQIDGGANFGLNRSTPDVELYAGISKRF